MDYQLKEITPQFYKYDAPIRHALLVLLLLLGACGCFQIYRDVFVWQKKSNEVVCIAVFLHATKPAVFCADVRDPHGPGQTFCTAFCHADFYVSVLCGEGERRWFTRVRICAAG